MYRTFGEVFMNDRKYQWGIKQKNVKTGELGKKKNSQRKLVYREGDR